MLFFFMQSLSHLNFIFTIMHLLFIIFTIYAIIFIVLLPIVIAALLCRQLF